MHLDDQDLTHIRTGALFVACSVDPLWCHEQADRALAHMTSSGARPKLVPIEQLPDDALIATIGFVNNGLPLSELRPPGDEFVQSVRILEHALERRVDGIIPLAAANVNALVPMLAGMQLDVPVVDADPQGRVFPRLHQTVFTLAGMRAGPVAVTGPIGESALLTVETPRHAERLVSALAGEFGGWAATAMYPMQASDLRQHGLHGTVSRLLRIGRVLDSAEPTEHKYDLLRRSEGITRIFRARVVDIAGLSRPSAHGEPDRPSSAILIEEDEGRIIQLEIQNELLMVLVDGVIEAAMPDIITMLHPDAASVASLEDLWVGNVLDIVVMAGAPRWYEADGLALVGPEAHQMMPSGMLNRGNR